MRHIWDYSVMMFPEKFNWAGKKTHPEGWLYHPIDCGGRRPTLNVDHDTQLTIVEEDHHECWPCHPIDCRGRRPPWMMIILFSWLWWKKTHHEWWPCHPIDCCSRLNKSWKRMKPADHYLFIYPNFECNLTNYSMSLPGKVAYMPSKSIS